MFYRKMSESVRSMVCAGRCSAILVANRLFRGWTNSKGFFQAREALEGGCKLGMQGSEFLFKLGEAAHIFRWRRRGNRVSAGHLRHS
jgi:hypothetical protein